jgi:uroporphyrinogen decarboxylase
MTPRERVLTTFRRGQPDRVPYDISFFNREALRKFREVTGANDPDEYFAIDKDIAFVDFLATKVDLKERFLKYHQIEADLHVVGNYDLAYAEGAELQSGQFYLSELGTGFQVGSNIAYDHFISPAVMMKAMRLEEIESYPLPDIMMPYRHEHLDDVVKSVRKNNLASVCSMEMTIFEAAWQIRGLDQLLMDFLVNEDMAACLLDRITDLSQFRARRCAQAGVDIIRVGDDVGMEDRMIISPDIWRKWLKPRLAHVIAAAKNVKRDILVSYHSDGYIEPIIAELIEIGVDILNPVQPECMDPAEIRNRYGDRLAFWGTISVQKTLPFGSPKDVEIEVKKRIDSVGKNGGLYLSPSHVIAPEVPYENIKTLVDTVKQYGWYQ